jgi:hypothetical protein
MPAALDPLLQVLALGALGGIVSIAIFQLKRHWYKRRGRKRVHGWIHSEGKAPEANAQRSTLNAQRSTFNTQLRKRSRAGGRRFRFGHGIKRVT